MRNTYNMGTPMSLKRIDAILAAMGQVDTATAPDLETMLGLPKQTIGRFLEHLCGTGEIEMLVKPRPGPSGGAAIYALARERLVTPSADGAPGAEADAEAEQPEVIPVRRVLLGVNDWPRGEHAMRTGLVAYLFPIWPAQEAA